VLEAREVLLAVFFFFRRLSLASSFLAAMAAALSSSAETKTTFIIQLHSKILPKLFCCHHPLIGTGILLKNSIFFVKGHRKSKVFISKPEVLDTT
jgi:hypothetical protein